MQGFSTVEGVGSALAVAGKLATSHSRNVSGTLIEHQGCMISKIFVGTECGGIEVLR
jgi:hypothetical protein